MSISRRLGVPGTLIASATNAPSMKPATRADHRVMSLARRSNRNVGTPSAMVAAAEKKYATTKVPKTEAKSRSPESGNRIASTAGGITEATMNPIHAALLLLNEHLLRTRIRR